MTNEDKQIEKTSHSNKGFTLVELIVTFALLSIFLSAGTVCISACLTQYQHVQDNTYAETVADTVMKKITGEISGAQYGSTTKYTMTIDHNGKCISFCNRKGSAMYIKATDNKDTYVRSKEAMPKGRLLIHYRPIKDQVSYEAEDWMFDEDVYSGYTIESLKFKLYKSKGKKTNVVLVTLTVKSEYSTYTYTLNQAVELYNFTSSTAVSNINENDNVLTDEEYINAVMENGT